MFFTVAAILAALTLASTLYAVALQRLEGRYQPDWVWLTVVAGNGLILGAQLVLYLLGQLTWLTALATNVAAGGPIIIWQVWQARRRQRQRLERQRQRLAQQWRQRGQRRQQRVLQRRRRPWHS